MALTLTDSPSSRSYRRQLYHGDLREALDIAIQPVSELTVRNASVSDGPWSTPCSAAGRHRHRCPRGILSILIPLLSVVGSRKRSAQAAAWHFQGQMHFPSGWGFFLLPSLCEPPWSSSRCVLVTVPVSSRPRPGRDSRPTNVPGNRSPRAPSAILPPIPTHSSTFSALHRPITVSSTIRIQRG